MFNAAVLPPSLQQSSGTATAVGVQQQQQQLQQSSDLVSTVDLTADSRTPIDYLTPPSSNADFGFQNFPSVAPIDPITATRGDPHLQQLQQLQSSSNSASVQQAPAPPTMQGQLASSSTIHITSPFTPNNDVRGFSSVQAQSSSASLMQTSSPSNQVNTLTNAGNPPPSFEQFTPYTPTLQHDQQQQQQNGVGRWELGFDANAILTPPFAIGSEHLGGQSIYQQDFGQEAASSVRSNKQYLGSGTFFGGNGGSFDATTTTINNKFTPLDAVIRSPPSNNNNNNVYWGTPKTAQQQLLRPPSPSFIEPNALRFNHNNNYHHHHHNNHHNHHHHSQFPDAIQMPFTSQFDGPLSQGTVADHVVHSSFRIKRQLQDNNNNDKKPPFNVAESNRDDSYSLDNQKPVYSFVKTDRNGNFKWSVRQGYY